MTFFEMLAEEERRRERATNVRNYFDRKRQAEEIREQIRLRERINGLISEYGETLCKYTE
jgi:hypothetical protein